MSDGGESTTRTALVTYFPMFIATLSLVAAIYNGYLNSKFVDLVQANVGRTEYMRTCKEVIDAYFQVKLRASVLSAAGDQTNTSAAHTDAANAVAKVAALGTWLASFRDEPIRARYTQLSAEVDRIVRNAGRTPPAELGKSFDAADRIFAELNDDCVKSAKSVPL